MFTWEGFIDDLDAIEPKVELCLCLVEERSIEMAIPDW